jgi:hypothetical protein
MQYLDIHPIQPGCPGVLPHAVSRKNAAVAIAGRLRFVAHDLDRSDRPSVDLTELRFCEDRGTDDALNPCAPYARNSPALRM